MAFSIVILMLFFGHFCIFWIKSVYTPNLYFTTRIWKKVIFSKIAEILSNFYISVPLYRVKSTFKCEFPGGARRCEDGIDIINSTLKMELNRLGLVLRTAESLSVFAFWKSAKLWETQQNSWNFHWQWHHNFWDLSSTIYVVMRSA